MPNDHPLWAWILDHLATLLNLFKRVAGGDTCTSIHRLRGRPWRVAFPPSGELVEYQRRGPGKLDKRYGLGIFLGIKVGTSERLVWCCEDKEIKYVQTFHRQPRTKIVGGEIVGSGSGTMVSEDCIVERI